MAIATPHPPADHHPAAGPSAPAPAARVEALGDAVELRAPGDVLVEALLGLPRDADPIAPRLLTEACDPAGGRPFLLLRARGGGQRALGEGPDDHDLVVFHRHVHSREPAVREPSGKPTFDRTELFLIHGKDCTSYM